MADKTKKTEAKTEAPKTGAKTGSTPRQPKRPGNQIIFDEIQKKYGTTAYFLEHRDKIAEMLKTMQEQKKDKRSNYGKTFKGKSKEELEQMVLFAQKMLADMQ